MSAERENFHSILLKIKNKNDKFNINSGRKRKIIKYAHTIKKVSQ